ncbi:MAG: hypothetical protein M3380_20280 [Chloroflexota bacterium]|nr:hypothetical protein [Chloroflexota bacterium]
MFNTHMIEVVGRERQRDLERTLNRNVRIAEARRATRAMELGSNRKGGPVMQAPSFISRARQLGLSILIVVVAFAMLVGLQAGSGPGGASTQTARGGHALHAPLAGHKHPAPLAGHKHPAPLAGRGWPAPLTDSTQDTTLPTYLIVGGLLLALSGIRGERSTEDRP